MRWFPAALVLAAVAGCASPPTGLAAEVPGTSWTLERVVLGDGRVLRGEGQVTFGADGSLVVASCNQCSGRFGVRDDVLTVAPALACTRRACIGDQVELERFLGGRSTLTRDGVYLVATPDSVDARVLLVPAATGT